MKINMLKIIFLICIFTFSGITFASDTDSSVIKIEAEVATESEDSATEKEVDTSEIKPMKKKAETEEEEDEEDEEDEEPDCD